MIELSTWMAIMSYIVTLVGLVRFIASLGTYYEKFKNHSKVSVMKMLSKLEKNLHRNKETSLQDLLIQKRRLVSNQGKRFLGVKVNKFGEKIDGFQYFDPTDKDNSGQPNALDTILQDKIESDIQKYKRNIKNQDKSVNNQESLLKNDISNEFGHFDADYLNPTAVNQYTTMEELENKGNFIIFITLDKLIPNEENLPIGINAKNDENDYHNYEQGSGPDRPRFEIKIDRKTNSYEDVYKSRSAVKDIMNKQNYSFDSFKTDQENYRDFNNSNGIVVKVNYF
jgi:hypothetical protein